MATLRTQIKVVAAAAALKAFADKVSAQIQKGKVTLEQLEAKARKDNDTA